MHTGAVRVQAQSKPMQAILKRMNLADEFDIVIFGDEVRWPAAPICGCVLNLVPSVLRFTAELFRSESCSRDEE